MSDARPHVLGIGADPVRTEDVRFLTGAGTYLDDLPVADAAHAVVVRSPHAHADILEIDTSAAGAMPGVIAVFTGVDLEPAGIRPMAPYAPHNDHTGEPIVHPVRRALALGRVRHVGEAVALVVARSVNEARDAAEAVSVTYRALAAAATVDAALAADAVPLAEGAADNVCMRWAVGDGDAVAAALDAAVHVVRLRVVNHRIVTGPMEPRGAVGSFDPAVGRYTLHVSSQSLHMTRDALARALGVDPENVRLVSPDVGGGFGTRNFVYPEYVLVAWAARQIGCPVKWVNERWESFVSDDQARDHVADAELGLDAEGRFVALRVASWANIGAYVAGAVNRTHTVQYPALAGGVYRIGATVVNIGIVFTNTVPVGVTRGPGYAESINIVERLVDQAARVTGIDRVELRRRNLLQTGEVTHPNYFGTVVDSGEFVARLESAVARADLDGFADRRRVSEGNGRLRGFGVAYHVKGTLGPPEERVDLRVRPDGTILFMPGTTAIGQGHETTFRQIVADRLSVPNSVIVYRAGDTDLIAKGGGHGSSRATHMAGSATHYAAAAILAKGRRIAAHALEVAEDDITYRDGRYAVVGTDRSIGLFDVAAIAEDPRRRPEGVSPGLSAVHDYTRVAPTFPNGCHVAEVEIDRETGSVSVVRFVTADDFGVIVNPRVAAGQLHGGIAQGIGQALVEQAVYDPQSGQVLAGSYMDYCPPRADDLPAFDIAFEGVPCTTNPLGVKGLGEAGAIGAFPAVASAILDALAPFGARELAGAATPERIWRLINGRG
jgi:carbon-monoxide dehydrogenase large subunit